MHDPPALKAFADQFDFLPVGVFRSHPDGSWLGVNRALARLNGYDTPAAYVAAVKDIAAECYVRPDDRLEFRRRLEAEGEVAGFEIEAYRHRTRERIWIRVSARAERDAAGALLHFQGTVEDITEAVQARLALEEREATLRQLANQVPGVLYRLRTRDGEMQRFEFIGDSLVELTGQTPAELYANPRAGWSIRHPEDAERVAAEIRRTNASGESLDVEYRIVLPGGRIKWLHQTSSVAHPEGGDVLRYGHLLDISPRKRAEAASQRAAQELEQIVALLPGAVFRYRRRAGGDASYSYVSAGVQSLLGLSVEEALASVDSLIRRIHPEDVAAFLHASDLAIESGASFSHAMRMLVPQPDGSVRVKWVHNVSAPAPADDGEVARVGVLLDVTARHEAEQAERRSALRLQQMVDLLPGVVFRAERDGPQGTRISYVSQAVEALFGVGVAEARARHDALVELTHPEDLPGLRHVLDRAVRDREPVSIEFRIRSRSGREKWVHLISQPALDALDGTDGRVGMLFDISARKAAERALRDSGDLWRRALESTGDGAWDWDIAAGHMQISDNLKALYGLPGELGPDAGPALEALVHPEDLAGMHDAIQTHLRGETPAFVHERRMRHADGRWLHILSRGVVLTRDADGRPLRMIGTHTDISARRQTEALRLERDAAAAADRAKTEFLSTVSHELRTPLNAVLGFAQLLEHAGLGGSRERAWVQQIIASGRHLLALMDDILDLSGVQSGRLRLAIEDVALAPLVQQAWAMLDAQARAQKVRLFDEVALQQAIATRSAGAAAAPALQVRADRRRLLQVLSNLLSNAIKYNRPGGSVRVAAQTGPGDAGDASVTLEVADTGAGLTPDQLARLFRPFERLDAQRGAIPGTGLGLAVSRGLAEAMGGTLTVRSVPGEGSVFVLKLPAAEG
jgi:PAS domain S-box-containing protein